MWACTQLKSPNNDDITQVCLTTAATIHYRRCFTAGKRKKLLAKYADELGEGSATSHEKFLNMADKQSAHSVNKLEDCQVGIVADENHNVIGVGTVFMKMSLSPEQADVLGRMAFGIKERITKEIEKLRETLISVESKSKPEDIASREVISIATPGLSDAGEDR